MQEFSIVDHVGNDALTWGKGPSVFCHEPMRDRKPDHALKALQRSKNQSSAGPRTSQRDVEVVAACFCFEPSCSRWPSRAICSDPIAKLRLATNELPGHAPVCIDPATLKKVSHGISLVWFFGLLTRERRAQRRSLEQGIRAL